MNLLDAQNNELQIGDKVVVAIPKRKSLLTMSKGVVKEVTYKDCIVKTNNPVGLQDKTTIKIQRSGTGYGNISFRILKI